VISQLVQQAIAGTVDAGAVSVMLPQTIEVRMHRNSDHLLLTWDTNPEVDLPGPINPDLLKVRLYADRAEVVTRLATIKMEL